MFWRPSWDSPAGDYGVSLHRWLRNRSFPESGSGDERGLECRDCQCDSSDMSAGLGVLAASGVEMPEVGYELADDHGVVVCEAELAWPHAKICVLGPEQNEFAAAWLQAGCSR